MTGEVLARGQKVIGSIAWPGEQEGESEFEEVERQLGGGSAAAAANGKPLAKTGSKASLNGDKGKWGLQRVLPPVLLEAFVLTFLAEWGDRSQVPFFPGWRMCSLL